MAPAGQPRRAPRSKLDKGGPIPFSRLYFSSLLNASRGTPERTAGGLGERGFPSARTPVPRQPLENLPGLPTLRPARASASGRLRAVPPPDAVHPSSRWGGACVGKRGDPPKDPPERNLAGWRTPQTPTFEAFSTT